MKDQTAIGGGSDSFPPTSWTQVRQAFPGEDGRSRQARALGDLLQSYWKPVYLFIRATWKKSNEEAKDLTQDFFALLLEGGYLERVRPEAGTFRAYLKTALRHFLVDAGRREKASKRGGGRGRISIDDDAAADLIADPDAASPDEAFDRAWRATSFAEAMRRLESELAAKGKSLQLQVFRAYYGVDAKTETLPPGGLREPEHERTERPSYEELAARFGIGPFDVGNHLKQVRKKFREALESVVRDYCASEEESRRELQELLGAS